MFVLFCVDDVETQNRLDSLAQTIEPLWYPLTNGLSTISFHSQQCSGETVSLLADSTDSLWESEVPPPVESAHQQ